MIKFDQTKGNYISTLIPVSHGFGTKQTGDGRNKKSLIIQSHSTNIHVLSSSDSKSVADCDGIITQIKNIHLSVITADCVPIIFYDSKHNISGISHQGWKGTLSNMAQKMITEMISLGSSPQHIKVAIGPSINECCYEVSEDVAQKFESKFDLSVVSSKDDKFFINLLRANYLQLISSGILKEHIDYFPFCTSCNKEKFWSYRRDKGIVGEMYSFINIF